MTIVYMKLINKGCCVISSNVPAHCVMSEFQQNSNFKLDFDIEIDLFDKCYI